LSHCVLYTVKRRSWQCRENAPWASNYPSSLTGAALVLKICIPGVESRTGGQKRNSKSRELTVENKYGVASEPGLKVEGYGRFRLSLLPPVTAVAGQPRARTFSHFFVCPGATLTLCPPSYCNFMVKFSWIWRPVLSFLPVFTLSGVFLH
jgi:hypothetical protein